MKYGPSLFLLLTCLAHVPGVAAQDRYGPWQTSDTTQQALVDRLRRLTEDAEKARAADRQFLRDLWDLIDEYDRPWGKEVLSDNFRDGDYTRNPAWTLISGDFTVERKFGLVSRGATAPAPSPAAKDEGRKDPGAELAMVLLESFLSKTAKQGARDEPAPEAPGADNRFGGPDLIHIARDIPAGFALTLDLEPLSSGGEFFVELYRDAPEGDGYRLYLTPGDSSPLRLTRRARGGSAVIDTVTQAVPQGPLALTWTRKDRGEMALAINGQRLLRTSDRTWRSGFKGLTVGSRDGRFAVRELTLMGAGR